MAFQLGEENGQGMNEMNLIPLIDIMLVLMIIFMVTATVLNPVVPLRLPETSAKVAPAPNNLIQISIDRQGRLFWDSQAVSLEELRRRLQAHKEANPTIALRADKEGKYDTVAQVLAAASEAGVTKINFVSE